MVRVLDDLGRAIQQPRWVDHAVSQFVAVPRVICFDRGMRLTCYLGLDSSRPDHSSRWPLTGLSHARIPASPNVPQDSRAWPVSRTPPTRNEAFLERTPSIEAIHRAQVVHRASVGDSRAARRADRGSRPPPRRAPPRARPHPWQSQEQVSAEADGAAGSRLKRSRECGCYFGERAGARPAGSAQMHGRP